MSYEQNKIRFFWRRKVQNNKYSIIILVCSMPSLTDGSKHETRSYIYNTDIYTNITITKSTITLSQSCIVQRHFTDASVGNGIRIFSLLPVSNPIQLTVPNSIRLIFPDFIWLPLHSFQLWVLVTAKETHLSYTPGSIT